MNKNFDILLIVFGFGLVLGSVLTTVVEIQNELVFESNSYIISVKAFISSLFLLSIISKIKKNNTHLILIIFILGLVNGYIFLMLFSTYKIFDILYRTFLYVVLLFVIIIIGCIQDKRNDNRIILILAISSIYAILSYFLY